MLALVHPVTGAALHWTAPPPSDMETLLAVLRERSESRLAAEPPARGR
jgi:hypothetical protein